MARIDIDLKSELPKLGKWTDTAVKQLPFATSQAINDVAFMVRSNVRDEMPRRFTIRRDWVTRQVDVVQKATKDKPNALVGPKPQVDFLARQQTGGAKLPRGNWIAIPTQAVRRTKSQMISKADRPAALGNRVHVERVGRSTFLALTGTKGAKARKGASGNRLRLLYLLVPRAQLEPRLGLSEIGLPVVRSNFQPRLAYRLSVAMSRAR